MFEFGSRESTVCKTQFIIQCYSPNEIDTGLFLTRISVSVCILENKGFMYKVQKIQAF